jgi:3-hydroxyacyl-[acyl-carrier-protein] dehydratase
MIEDREKVIKSLKRHKLPFAEEGAVDVDYSRADIEKILPHRNPFALLDRITRMNRVDQVITTETVIDPNDAVFAGHFPGHPVYPGVLQIEMMGQAGLALIYFLNNNTDLIKEDNKPVVGLFTRVHNAGFIHAVEPGDKLEVRARMHEYDEFLGIMVVQIWKGDQLCSHSILEAYLMD